MRLTDLHPKWEREVLVFDCPCGNGHRVRVPCARHVHQRTKNIWRIEGDSVLNYTITPVIGLNCWRGVITKGEVIDANAKAREVVRAQTGRGKRQPWY